MMSSAEFKLGHQLAFDNRLSEYRSVSSTAVHLWFAGSGWHAARAFGHGGELRRWAPTSMDK